MNTQAFQNLTEKEKVICKGTGERLRALRLGRGLTLEGVCFFSGIGEKILQEIEGGQRRMPLEELFLFSELFEVSMDYIITGSIASEGKEHPA